jgi:DHA1 family bicyclomycin/chloramphenicol resistance-like MFS transporter
MYKYNNYILLVIMLAVLSSVPPLATDAYIPAMPDMAKYFGENIENIELTISIFLFGFSVGQLAGGYISDRVGRKLSSLCGLLGFGIFSFAIIFSSNVYELWIYRFIEALFGGMVFINSFAVVRDKFHGNEAAKVLSLIGSIGAIAPLAAPIIGSSLVHFFTWKSIFIFLGIYSFLVFVFIFLFLEESYTKAKQVSIFESIKTVFSKKVAFRYMLLL